MARPLAGTTLTHMAALFVLLGPEKAERLFTGIKRNGVTIVDGNALAKDLVVEGEARFCLTDTDDARIGVREDPRLSIVVPDQGAGGMGAVLIPGSVALVKNGPNPREAKRCIEFLLSRTVVRSLLENGAFQVPLRGDVPVPEGAYGLDDVRWAGVDWTRLPARLPEVRDILTELFLN
jgi:iron(III) transport system substrate-binding protein